LSELKTDIVVIGAGVIGLAVARRFALAGLEVVVVEQERTFGTGTSSRNSEVIHAGLYYPSGSLKAKLCLTGREQLYEYCNERRIPHKQLGKLIVAADAEETIKLEAIYQQAQASRCDEVALLSGKEVDQERGALKAVAMLLSPRTGIIDSHQLMLSLLADLVRAGGLVAWKTRVESIAASTQGASVLLDKKIAVNAACVVNAAGLGAADFLSNSDSGYGTRLAKGDYFSYSGRIPFTRLVYPVPQPGGLGVHFTIDMGGAGRFGPDVTWVDEVDYSIDSAKRHLFFERIRKYWPDCDIEKLSPSYSGIRSKATCHGEMLDDFLFVTESYEPRSKIIHLLGIESPGLTSCLSIADHIFKEVY